LTNICICQSIDELFSAVSRTCGNRTANTPPQRPSFIAALVLAACLLLRVAGTPPHSATAFCGRSLWGLRREASRPPVTLIGPVLLCNWARRYYVCQRIGVCGAPAR
jgi:hypothetical protein